MKNLSQKQIKELGTDFIEMMKPLQSFEDACKIEKLDPKKIIPDFSMFPKQDRKSMIAHAKLVIIVKAANRLANDNKEWIPDFTNIQEIKYENWFYLGEGSSGFRFDDCDCWNAISDVGSRLCFKSREVGKYVAYMFLELYKEYFL